MSDKDKDNDKPAATEAGNKATSKSETVRVRVLKHRAILMGCYRPKDAIVSGVPMAEAEMRARGDEVEIINVESK